MPDPVADERPDNEVGEIDVSSDPLEILRNLVLTFEGQRKLIAELVLWPLSTPWGKKPKPENADLGAETTTRRPIRPTEAMKGMPPMIVQIIKRAQQSMECRDKADEMESDVQRLKAKLESGEIDGKAWSALAAMNRTVVDCRKLSAEHQSAAEALLMHQTKADMERMKAIQEAIDRSEDRRQRDRSADKRIQARTALGKLPNAALLEFQDR